MSLLLSALLAVPWGEVVALPSAPAPSGPQDPQSYRTAALDVKDALSDAGFKTDSVRLQSRAGHLYLAVQMNPKGWQKAMRSLCNRKLAITLWAFGFRHSGEDDSSSPFLLSKELASTEDMDDVRRFSKGMKEGAAECRAEAAAKKSSEEDVAVELPERSGEEAAVSRPPEDESFAELAARSSHWPLSKRLVPVTYTMSWSSPKDYFDSINNFEHLLRTLRARRRASPHHGLTANGSVAKLAAAARARTAEARASAAPPSPDAPPAPVLHRSSGDTRPRLHLASNSNYTYAAGGTDAPSAGSSSNGSSSEKASGSDDPLARARRRAAMERIRALLLAMLEASGQPPPARPAHRHCVRTPSGAFVCSSAP